MCEENFKTSPLLGLHDEFDFQYFERLVKALTPIADIAVLMDVDETILRDAIEDPNQEHQQSLSTHQSTNHARNARTQH